VIAPIKKTPVVDEAAGVFLFTIIFTMWRKIAQSRAIISAVGGKNFWGF